MPEIPNNYKHHWLDMDRFEPGSVRLTINGLLMPAEDPSFIEIDPDKAIVGIDFDADSMPGPGNHIDYRVTALDPDTGRIVETRFTHRKFNVSVIESTDLLDALADSFVIAVDALNHNSLEEHVRGLEKLTPLALEVFDRVRAREAQKANREQLERDLQMIRQPPGPEPIDPPPSAPVTSSPPPFDALRLRPILADFIHELWAHWMGYMMPTLVKDFGEVNSDAAQDIHKAKCVQRWALQAGTAYRDLTPKEQESDLELADKLITLLTTNPLGELKDG